MEQKLFFAKLRKKLPHRYVSLISRKLIGVTASQVKCVFKGETTDPEKVELVRNEALFLKAILRKNTRLPTPKKAAKRKRRLN